MYFFFAINGHFPHIKRLITVTAFTSRPTSFEAMATATFASTTTAPGRGAELLGRAVMIHAPVSAFLDYALCLGTIGVTHSQLHSGNLAQSG